MSGQRSPQSQEDGSTNTQGVLTFSPPDFKCYSCDQQLPNGALTNDCPVCGAPYHPSCFKKAKKNETTGGLSKCCEKPISKAYLNNAFERFFEKLNNSLPTLVASQVTSQLTSHLEATNVRIDNAELDIMEIKQRVSSIEEKVTSAAHDTTSIGPANITNSLMREFREREKRACNIIVYNLPEAGNDDADQRSLNNVLKKFQDFPCCTSTSRFGDPSNEPRPLRAIFGSERDALMILKNRAKFSRSKIQVDSDRTFEQRKYLHVLREELANRVERGEKDITIKYVDGVPCIVAKNQKNVK